MKDTKEVQEKIELLYQALAEAYDRLEELEIILSKHHRWEKPILEKD